MSNSKAQLRDLLRRTRATLTQPYRDDATARVNAHLAALPMAVRGVNMGGYAANRFELNIDPALTRLMAAGIHMHLPRVIQGEVAFAPCQSLDELVRGFASIREPVQMPVAVETLDVLLVPGVGFDLSGNRLGQGAGHYDRILARVAPSCVTIGVAFQQQIVPEIPVEPHDLPVRLLLTENGIQAAVSAS